MRKIPASCAAVCGRVIFIGFGVQIILGLIWMCNAFVKAGSLICVFQTAALGVAVCFVQNIMRKDGTDVSVLQKLFRVAAVLTFPMIVQCLVTADVRTFTSALLLLESGCIMAALDNEEDNIYFRAALCAWMAAGLIRREYIYFGVVPMIIYIIYIKESGAVRKTARAFLYRILLILAVGGMTMAIGSFYQQTVNPAVRLADRTAWTSLYKSYVDMEGKDRKLIDYQTMVESAYEAVGIDSILFPSLERAHGTKEAERILTELSKAAWKNRKSQIVKEIIWDMAGYAVTPVVLPMQLEGRAYDSYSGVNYLQILRASPRLGSIYMTYGCRWFAVCAIISIVTIVSCAASKKGRRHSGMLRNYIIMAASALCMCIGYTLGESGRMDYKNVIFVLCVWMIWMISVGESGVARAGGLNGKEE